jgi:hypothetical protein
MALYIPILYGVVDKTCRNRPLLTWDDAIRLLKEPDDPNNLAAAGIRMATSRNWWYQDLLDRICLGTPIVGIEFATVLEGWCCICEDELKTAYQAIEQVVNLLNSSISHLGEWEDVIVEDLRQHLTAFQQAEISFDIGGGGSYSRRFEANRDFCSFVKTLHFTMAEALERDACFLYVVLPA